MLKKYPSYKNILHVRFPSELLTPFFAVITSLIFNNTFGFSIDFRSCAFKHSSLSRPLNVSKSSLSVGFQVIVNTKLT